MSRLRHFPAHLKRHFSTSRILYRPALSADYKSKDLWDDRFDCNLLGGDQGTIKTINAKIMTGSQLNNLEVDIFINIAAPRRDDVAQLQEAARTLRNFRKSLEAHKLLPSTSHAICRLFIGSARLASCARLLERRVEFGIFPDEFSLNLLFDCALEKEDYALASRVASLIMLQEEFGLSQLNDNFALYSVAKYIESRTDFSDWIKSVSGAPDPILNPDAEENQGGDTDKGGQQKEAKAEEERGEEGNGEEEEEEDDAEYIRIPYLRNPYNDKHFDLDHPRQICGKTLSMLGLHFGYQQEQQPNNEHGLSLRCKLLGDILQGNWSGATEVLDKCLELKVGLDQTVREAAKFYIVENLSGVVAPDDKARDSMLVKLEKLPQAESSISQEAEARHEKLSHLEREDINQLRQNLVQWSELRLATKQAWDDLEARKKLIAEIKAKKEELRLREQYLYFYDNLKKNSLTRIEYD